MKGALALALSVGVAAVSASSHPCQGLSEDNLVQCQKAYDEVGDVDTLCDAVGFEGSENSFSISAVTDAIVADQDDGFYSALASICDPDGERDNGRRLGGKRKALANFGCCSMDAGFLVGARGDSADCSNYQTYKRIAGPHDLSKKHCRNHDVCLINAGGSCSQRGNCDWQLYRKASTRYCNWWKSGYWGCRASAHAIATVMFFTPNGC